jgi:hypothetical protein
VVKSNTTPLGNKSLPSRITSRQGLGLDVPPQVVCAALGCNVYVIATVWVEPFARVLLRLGLTAMAHAEFIQFAPVPLLRIDTLFAWFG